MGKEYLVRIVHSAGTGFPSGYQGLIQVSFFFCIWKMFGLIVICACLKSGKDYYVARYKGPIV